MMHWIWYNGWQSGWGGLIMGGMMILFWAAVIGGIYLVLRSLIRTGTLSRPERSPMDILQERLAKGEINEADYDRIKQKLNEDSRHV